VAVSETYREYVRDMFHAFGPVRLRSMFGAAGIFRDELMIGLIIGEEIYLKADDHNRTDFEEAGMEPFQFERRDGRIMSMSYYPIPDALYDDPEELAKWALRAHEAAVRGIAKKAPRRKRKR
jgi:DNA transformation protein and related proteins